MSCTTSIVTAAIVSALVQPSAMANGNFLAWKEKLQYLTVIFSVDGGAVLLIFYLNKYATIFMIFQIGNIAFTDAGGLLSHLITWKTKDLAIARIGKNLTKQKAVTKIYSNIFIKIILLETSAKKEEKKKSEPEKNKQISLQLTHARTHKQ